MSLSVASGGVKSQAEFECCSQFVIFAPTVPRLLLFVCRLAALSLKGIQIVLDAFVECRAATLIVMRCWRCCDLLSLEVEAAAA